jgi:hypothetical protein
LRSPRCASPAALDDLRRAAAARALGQGSLGKTRKTCGARRRTTQRRRPVARAVAARSLASDCQSSLCTPIEAWP